MCWLWIGDLKWYVVWSDGFCWDVSPCDSIGSRAYIIYIIFSLWDYEYIIYRYVINFLLLHTRLNEIPISSTYIRGPDWMSGFVSIHYNTTQTLNRHKLLEHWQFVSAVLRWTLSLLGPVIALFVVGSLVQFRIYGPCDQSEAGTESWFFREFVLKPHYRNIYFYIFIWYNIRIFLDICKHKT